MHGKALNRLRRQLTDLHLGILPDVGQHHAKGYRYSIGKLPDGTDARIWLGHNQSEAQRLAGYYLSEWGRIVKEGGTSWPPGAISNVQDVVKRHGEMVRQYTDGLRQELKYAERSAAERRASYEEWTGERLPSTLGPSPQVDAVTPTAADGKTLYNAIDAYLESLRGKRLSPECHSDKPTPAVRTR